MAGDGQFSAGNFDSLGAVEMANGVSSALGLKLPQTLVFDYPSVVAMAAYVHSLMAPATAAARMTLVSTAHTSQRLEREQVIQVGATSVW
jgi:hypothetical protein